MGGRSVFVVGVGMTKFVKPGQDDGWNYPEMAHEAGTKALKDAGITYDQVQQACVGYVYGGTTCGQRAVYELGMTGIPVYNVNNACSSGSTALMLARQLIEGGLSDCVLALGFEKMERTLTIEESSRTQPMDRHVAAYCDLRDLGPEPMTAQLFGSAGIEHMDKYGTKPEHFAKIAHKNHKHSKNNPYSQMQTEYSLDEVQNSKVVFGPLTKLQCCPTSDGAAAAILVSEDFVLRHGLQANAVEIVAQAMATDLPATLNSRSCIQLVGSDMTKRAAAEVYGRAGVQPGDLDVIELHDCFATNELLTYEALGLCPEGGGGALVDRGDNTYGGRHVINPSGGLISKGHPLGATGLAQCAELCWQLRGAAGPRQVAGAKLGLQHNLGLGGAVVITLYRAAFPDHKPAGPDVKTLLPGSDYKSATVFNQIQEELKTDGAKYVKKINGVFRFEVKGKDNKQQVWVVDVKNGTGEVKMDDTVTGDATISINDEDLFSLMMGKLNPQAAFFQGKLKIKGNMGVAMKLRDLMQANKAKL